MAESEAVNAPVATTPGGEPLWCAPKPTVGICYVTSATSNRVKQAAPGNDLAFVFNPACLLVSVIDSRFADELQRAGYLAGAACLKRVLVSSAL
jgi:hypothetical protein